MIAPHRTLRTVMTDNSATSSTYSFSSASPADKLDAAVKAVAAPVCVGIDPVLGRLPDAIGQPSPTDPDACAMAIEHFGRSVIDAVAKVVPAVKPQSACFERFGHAGVRALEAVIAHAHDAGLEVILDAKRGDIGLTAGHYEGARARTGAAWLTANPYLGDDGLRPLLEGGGGVFSLVRTSNPSGDAIQAMTLTGGGSVAEHVAGLVAKLGSEFVGESGFSSLGAVVGATKPDDAARLRELMPQQILLIPGYGAQGGGVDTVKSLFLPGGRGAVVTASRSVIYAFASSSSSGSVRSKSWTDDVHDAARVFAEEVGCAAGLR